MAVYAISDLHLSFGVDKPMNIFGTVWDNYEEMIRKNWIETVTDEDTVIIPGDISWGMTLDESVKDFEYINSLPGKKIILKGNHDYYFSTKSKMQEFFNEHGFSNFQILQNNAIETNECIICGTRGWGKTELTDAEQDKKIIAREEIRLKLSLDAGKKIQQEQLEEGEIVKDIVVAMHFPPFVSNFANIMESYGVKQCMYGHLHGFAHKFVKEGIENNIEYKFVGCDYTGFKLVKIK